MANVLKLEKKLQVIHMLVEGVSLRSVERVTGVQKKTAMRLMVKFGQRCRAFLDQKMRGLELYHLECDEQWTFVGKKQGRIKPEDVGTAKIGDQYLWLAIDQAAKLIPTFIIGK